MADDKKEWKDIIQTYQHEKEIKWKPGETWERGDVENPMVAQAPTPPGAQQVPTNPGPQAVAAATRWACEFCLIFPHSTTIILIIVCKDGNIFQH